MREADRRTERGREGERTGEASERKCTSSLDHSFNLISRERAVRTREESSAARVHKERERKGKRVRRILDSLVSISWVKQKERTRQTDRARERKRISLAHEARVAKARKQSWHQDRSTKRDPGSLSAHFLLSLPITRRVGTR